MIQSGIVKPLLPTNEKTPASIQQFADAFRQTDPTTAQALSRVQQHFERIYGILQSTPEAQDPIVITDQNGKLIAWIGSQDKYVGAFFAQVYIGGDGPETANLFVDNSGTLNIHNAIVVVQKDGATTTLGNYIDANGTMGIQVQNDLHGYKTAMGDNGLYVWDDAEAHVIAEVTNSGGTGVGRVTAYDPASGKYSRLLPGRVEVFGGAGNAVTIEDGNVQFGNSGLTASMPLKLDGSKKLKTEKINLSSSSDITGSFTTGLVLYWNGTSLASMTVGALAALVAAYFSTGNHAHIAGPYTTNPGGTDGHTHTIDAVYTSPPA